MYEKKEPPGEANHNSTIPPVSIITSVYNGALYLPECIQSILNQTFQDFEFILVDDGSTDQSWEIIQKFAALDSRIVTVHNVKNQGVVAGLNKGVAIAKGQYIARQDADDVSQPERLAQQKAFLDANPAYGLAACHVTYVNSDGEPIDRENPFSAVENEEIQEKLLDHMCLCGPTVMLRREALDAAGKWFGSGLDASEDYDLCLRVAEVTRLYSIPKPLYLYRQHAQSASIAQEYKQIIHKAAALEQAFERRKGANANVVTATLGKDYLWAAVLAHTKGDGEAARESIAKMLAIYPSIVENPELFERFLQYRMPEDAALALAYVDTFFSRYLPKASGLKRLRSKLISFIHMKEVFIGAKTRDRKRIKAHLWNGLRENPGWLKNRGILSIAIRYGL